MNGSHVEERPNYSAMDGMSDGDEESEEDELC
jgi:hypothetical protein